MTPAEKQKTYSNMIGRVIGKGKDHGTKEMDTFEFAPFLFSLGGTDN